MMQWMFDLFKTTPRQSLDSNNPSRIKPRPPTPEASANSRRNPVFNCRGCRACAKSQEVKINVAVEVTQHDL